MAPSHLLKVAVTTAIISVLTAVALACTEGDTLPETDQDSPAPIATTRAEGVQPGTIAGRVVLSGEEADSGVTVTLRQDGEVVEKLITGASGIFEFTGLSEAFVYTLVFEKEGYLPTSRDGLKLEGGLALPDILLTTVPLEGVTGKVTLFGESDHSGVQVHASGWRQTVTATTATDGRYTLTGLAEGYNVIWFQKDGFAPVNQGVMVRKGEPVTFPDITLYPVGSLTGRVLNPDGSGAAGVVVFLCPSNPGGRAATRAFTDDQGQYRFEAFPGFYQATSFLIEQSMVGEGADTGGLGITVLITPREETTAEDMILRRYGEPGDWLAGFPTNLATCP